MTLNPILIAAAVIPAVILLVRVYKADRLDKEPPKLLVSLVLFGILSTFIAVVTELIGSYALSYLVAKDTILYNAIEYFIIVAFSEEGAKYILLKKRTWKSPHFNCQFDGVVYAVFVSLGFALWENIGYVAQNGLGNALLRAVTAVPGHACFGVFMGVFYGAAKRFENMGNEQLSKKYRRLSLLVPILMHGTYDFIATLSSSIAGLFFLVFIAVMFTICYRLVKSAAASDNFIAQPETQFDPQQWSAQPYGSQQYGTQPYNPQQYGAQSYNPQQYGAQPYNPQQYGAQPYNPQQYGAQPYNPQQYGAQPYNPQPYNAQPDTPQLINPQPNDLDTPDA